MRKHYDIRISGRVQGVFFRGTAKDIADGLGVKGFARNEPDGSVFVEAEGEKDPLERFVEWCRVGPPLARVESVQCREGPVRGHSGFAVRYA